MHLKALMVAITSVSVLAVSIAGQSTSPQSVPFVGADACRDCHTDYYQAWSATKHARAITRLTSNDRAGGLCIRCHVTGTPEMIAADGAMPRFPNVQCEACHGAGRAHVEAAQAGNAALARIDTVNAATCTRCHNESSPNYKTFIYNALIGLVHRRG